MARIHDQTAGELIELAQKHPTVLVGYSDGKDSRALLHLASKCFPKVYAYFMYFLRDLQCVQMVLPRSLGVSVLEYPHPLLFDSLRAGLYRLSSVENAPSFSTTGINDQAMKDTGATLVLLGHKKTDGLWRRHLKAKQYARESNIRFPIWDWKKFEVEDYLNRHNIPIPDAYDDTSTSINLSAACICWLYDKWPQDYERIRKIFPLVECIIKRREWYGLGVTDRSDNKDVHRSGGRIK